jgi:hypothetical protein
MGTAASHRNLRQDPEAASMRDASPGKGLCLCVTGAERAEEMLNCIIYWTF